VKQGDHGHDDTIQDYLQTWHAGDQTERPENPEGSESFDIELLDLHGGQNCADDPNHDDREVEDIPGIPEISILVLEEALCDDLHNALGSEDEEENVFNFFQNCICFVGILAGERGVHRQTDTVAHDGEKYEEVKGFPFNEGYAMFPQRIFKGKTSHRLLSPVRWRLGPHPPCRLLGVHLDLVAIGRCPIQGGVPR